jgi:hypothetical protein
MALNYTTVKSPQFKTRRGLNQMFGGRNEQAFDYNAPGSAPKLENEGDIFDTLANKGETFRRQEEDRSFGNIMESLQDRGLAKSGMPIRQAMESIVGPSAARASDLASTFGIAEAQRLSELNENARAADRGMSQQKLVGAQGMLKGDMDNIDEFDIAKMNYDLEMEKLAQAKKQKKSKSMRGAVGGAVGGIAGGYLGSLFGPVGSSAGSTMGSSLLSQMMESQ